MRNDAPIEGELLGADDSEVCIGEAKQDKVGPRKGPSGLTAKQEAFAVAYAMGKTSAREAYAEAYGVGSMSPASQFRRASELLAHPIISSRITELRRAAVARVHYAYDEAMAEAMDALETCRKLGQGGAMVAAVTLRAKISGLMVEDRRNARTPLGDLSEAQLVELIQAKQVELALLPAPQPAPQDTQVVDSTGVTGA